MLLFQSSIFSQFMSSPLTVHQWRLGSVTKQQDIPPPRILKSTMSQTSPCILVLHGALASVAFDLPTLTRYFHQPQAHPDLVLAPWCSQPKKWHLMSNPSLQLRCASLHLISIPWISRFWQCCQFSPKAGCQAFILLDKLAVDLSSCLTRDHVATGLAPLPVDPHLPSMLSMQPPYINSSRHRMGQRCCSASQSQPLWMKKWSISSFQACLATCTLRCTTPIPPGVSPQMGTPKGSCVSHSRPFTVTPCPPPPPPPPPPAFILTSLHPNLLSTCICRGISSETSSCSSLRRAGVHCTC